MELTQTVLPRCLHLLNCLDHVSSQKHRPQSLSPLPMLTADLSDPGMTSQGGRAVVLYMKSSAWYQRKGRSILAQWALDTPTLMVSVIKIIHKNRTKIDTHTSVCLSTWLETLRGIYDKKFAHTDMEVESQDTQWARRPWRIGGESSNLKDNGPKTLKDPVSNFRSRSWTTPISQTKV